MIKVNYYIESIDAICVETFNTIKEMKEWIVEHLEFEIMDIDVLDKNGYFIIALPVEDYVKTL